MIGEDITLSMVPDILWAASKLIWDKSNKS
jgi:hypothetical protein